MHIIGGGLAGSEAAWQLACAGVPVVMHEMRPVRGTEAHQTEQLAELVCSNSFRSDDALNNAVGLLHEEMRRADSLIMRAADAHKLPAGGALAVDRHGFSAAVQETLLSHPLVELRREEVAGLPPEDWDSVIVATGPLTSPALAEAVAKITGESALAFFDAIAPIVHHDSIDQSIAWKQSRYDKVGPGSDQAGDGADYFNCPLDKEQYEAFVAALLAGEKTEFKEWEHNTPYFQGCQPIEVIAASGPQSLRFGPMKPVGLRDPRTGRRPWAVVQLRQDNALGTLWNIVGFQTKLKHGEQVRIFRTIPGLAHAEFARLGGLHRNTFLNSPRLLDPTLRLKAMPRLRFAGQITGCEGYVESAAVGLLAGRFAAAERQGRVQAPPPPTTAMGALLGHITGGADASTFQPMNVNFGLFPPLSPSEEGGNARGKERKQALARRALNDFDQWIGPTRQAAA
ncbi:methylenetetrahydrofolate--tRNA-(uracil-5-)-methyltransferase [Enhydrobacter aerosaccus]|uniref:Methylenetetrahydrofolate--tRNA-(uracil-5-)-methyltransferase TrmFO n=1 Tax=Enhydrobacter aerosaccus TaxID=225324 RepID=A0A1T4JUY1_9HYPH|nr:methylenetetrahydrofolate--tRNA-(uracil-5-)-methyltransferase [Enhydrobacter aerosaccus]